MEIVPDERRRVIGADAREVAGCGRVSPNIPLHDPSPTYFDAVVREMEMIVWRDAFDKRKKRLERIRDRGTVSPDGADGMTTA